MKALEQQGQQVIRLGRNDQEVPEADYIYHLAAYGNKYDQEDEEEIFEANIMQLWWLLQTTKNMPYKGLINFSTSTHVQDTHTFYGGTKKCGEELIAMFAAEHQKPCISVRPFSVYGPGDDPKHFIPVAIKAFKENEPLKLAPGVHDWIYVDDLISGVIKVSENAQELRGQGVDIGTGVETSNHEIVSILRGLTGIPGNITRVEQMRSYDGGRWVANNSILKGLGWNSTISINEGLSKLYYGNRK